MEWERRRKHCDREGGTCAGGREDPGQLPFPTRLSQGARECETRRVVMLEIMYDRFVHSAAITPTSKSV